MKKLLLGLALLLTSLPGWGQTTPETVPEQMTSAFFKALENEDVPALNSLTTDDFGLISFNGQLADRALLGQGLSGGYLVMDVASANNFRTRLYNGNTALVVGNSTFKGSLQGNNFDKKLVFTVTCVKVGNAWKIAGVQLSGGEE